MLTRSIRDSESSIDFVQGPPGSRWERVNKLENYINIPRIQVQSVLSGLNGFWMMAGISNLSLTNDHTENDVDLNDCAMVQIIQRFMYSKMYVTALNAHWVISQHHFKSIILYM